MLRFSDASIEARYQVWYHSSRVLWDFPGQGVGLVIGLCDILGAARFCSVYELWLWLFLWAAIVLLGFLNFNCVAWYSKHRNTLVCMYKVVAVLSISFMRRHWEVTAFKPFLVKILFMGSFSANIAIMNFGAPSLMADHLRVNTAQVLMLGASNYWVCKHMYKNSQAMQPFFDFIGAEASRIGAAEVGGWMLYRPISGVQVCAVVWLVMQVVLGFFIPTLVLGKLEERNRGAFADRHALVGEQREIVEGDDSVWFSAVFIFGVFQLLLVLGH